MIEENTRTQRVTEIDLAHRRIRLPMTSKKFFPAFKTLVSVDLRGQLCEARYDPRLGPDRPRSATLVFAKSIAHLVEMNETLSIKLGADDTVCLA